jgi:beta-phosphoglucomutase
MIFNNSEPGKRERPGKRVELHVYKAFIFDLDGTLIDSERFHCQAFEQAVKRLTGYQISEDERRGFFCSHTKEFFPQLARSHALTVDAEAILKLKRQLVDEQFRAEWIPGAEAFVQTWHGRKKFAVASNSEAAFVRRALKALGAEALFPLVTGGDAVARKKPDPEIYRQCAAALDTRSGETLVFEDTINGAAAALAAGCNCVFVQTGAPRDMRAVPEGVVPCTWRELLEMSDER